jgi:hypothetical protein
MRRDGDQPTTRNGRHATARDGAKSWKERAHLPPHTSILLKSANGIEDLSR